MVNANQILWEKKHKVRKYVLKKISLLYYEVRPNILAWADHAFNKFIKKIHLEDMNEDK